MAPQRILPRQAQHQPLVTRGRWTAGAAPPAGVVLLRRQPAVPGQERRWGDRETWPSVGVARSVLARRTKRGPLARTGPGRPAGAAPRSHAGAPAFRRYRPVAAEQRDDQAECPPGQRVDDLEQHGTSQPSLSPACWRQCRSTTQSSIRAVQPQVTPCRCLASAGTGHAFTGHRPVTGWS